MTLLVIDTSGPVCGAAVMDEEKVCSEITVQNRNTHSVNLMPMVEYALEAAGKHTVRDVSKMVVEIPYTLLGKLQNLEKNEPFMIEDAIYTDAVTLHLSMNLEDENRVEALLMEVSAGNAKILETSQICC